jgi:hypothetical protein
MDDLRYAESLAASVVTEPGTVALLSRHQRRSEPAIHPAEDALDERRW